MCCAARRSIAPWSSPAPSTAPTRSRGGWSQAGIAAEAIHGNKSQGQRERALAAFRNGKVKTLVATDIAARGIDVDGISHVVNFDLPNVPETYVHRIGRTARAGAEGIAISLCDGEETAFLRDIEKLIRMSIPSSDRRTHRQGGEPSAERHTAQRQWIAETARRKAAPVVIRTGRQPRIGIGTAAMVETAEAAASSSAVTSSRPASLRQATRASLRLPSCIATPRRGATIRIGARARPGMQRFNNAKGDVTWPRKNFWNSKVW